MARHTFFTSVLDLGEIERFVVLYMVEGYVEESKGQEGMRL
jgi:hypothetical protein